jgi:mono/diheme cytochrome c family protein
MGRIALVTLFVCASFSLSPPAPAQDAKLGDTEILGRQVYAQHCGVCHTKPTITSPYYGPPLSKDNVSAGTDVMREFIQTGTDRMPGFRYSLQPAQIDAVIQYLKTLSPPADANAPARPASSRANEREVD